MENESAGVKQKMASFISLIVSKLKHTHAHTLTSAFISICAVLFFAHAMSFVVHTFEAKSTELFLYRWPERLSHRWSVGWQFNFFFENKTSEPKSHFNWLASIYLHHLFHDAKKTLTTSQRHNFIGFYRVAHKNKKQNHPKKVKNSHAFASTINFHGYGELKRKRQRRGAERKKKLITLL